MIMAAQLKGFNKIKNIKSGIYKSSEDYYIFISIENGL